MDGQEEQFVAEEGKLADLNAESLLSADAAPPLTLAPCKECSNGNGYDELISKEYSQLLNIAHARIRFTCIDPVAHKEDVTQGGVQKFWRAVSKRESGYSDAKKVLRDAVWQEGVRHSQTCGREVPVDFNQLDISGDRSEGSNSDGYGTSELRQKTFINPTEMYHCFRYLDEKLKDADKELFVMYYVEGRTLTEIAAVRGCCVMTVSRALEKLRKCLGVPDD